MILNKMCVLNKLRSLSNECKSRQDYTHCKRQKNVKDGNPFILQEAFDYKIIYLK